MFKVLYFYYDFYQPKDVNGRPTGKPVFRGIRIVLESQQDLSLEEWAMAGSLSEATYGEKVKFTIGTKDIDDNTILNFILYDYDGNYNPDDELSSFTTKVKNNIAELEFIPDIKWEESAKYEADKVIETYFKVEAEIKGEKISAQIL